MAKAFLSHSSTDKELVEEIAKALGPNKCHYDRFTFEAGNKTMDEIFSALDQTDIFVLFISEAALKSEWVQTEIQRAELNLSSGIINRIFPIIIDSSVSYSDVRIPSWIRKPYNLQTLDNQVLILKKVKQLIRKADFQQHKHLQELDELFVGRNELMQKFETQFINIEGTIPSCIIAYSYIEGIGRRIFLRNALKKVKIVSDPAYDPLIIPIEKKESIEDYIYKLNLINPQESVMKEDFSVLSLDQKLEIARELTLKFISNNEILFIEDQGSILLPNSQIAEWFLELLEFPEFQNRVCFCVVANYKPSPFLLNKFKKRFVSFRVEELSKPDTQNLFLQYLRIMQIELSPEDKRMFISVLNGVPAQIIFAANFIETAGILDARKAIDEIRSFSDQSALSIYDFFKNEEHTQQLLIALSKFEIASYELISRLFDNEDELRKSLQSLFDLSAISFMFSGVEYMKLNSAIADYILRSRIQLNSIYQDRLSNLIHSSVAEGNLDQKLKEDYSEFLFTLQNMVLSGKTIPKKFFIPSYILKTIVQKYYDRDFKTVIQLSEKLLESKANYDEQVIRETNYWLCQAYAKTKSEHFFEAAQYFKDSSTGNNKDHYFLLGFYYRCCRNYTKAKEYYMKVLDIDDRHSRTKRELVIVYRNQGQFEEALNLAKDNYTRFTSNIYHAQAYFECLIKKYIHDEEEMDMIHEIMDVVENSLHERADDIYNIMEGEYEFYINKNLSGAISILTDALKINDSKIYAYRSLCEIYKKKDMQEQLLKLQSQYKILVEASDDSDE